MRERLYYARQHTFLESAVAIRLADHGAFTKKAPYRLGRTQKRARPEFPDIFGIQQAGMIRVIDSFNTADRNVVRSGEGASDEVSTMRCKYLLATLLIDEAAEHLAEPESLRWV